MAIFSRKEAITGLAIRRGFTGAGLARATGLTQGHVSQIMSGKRSILPPTAIKICSALDCQFDDIFVIIQTPPDGGL